ncbi:hypothetical protein BJ322DRAFT_260561 [Thelephora terrestris]|uniref:Protein-S-isoprenylcysteine O-methyltransferase n=1 Tax=Thelephora terrestris TaxID=56493 RepID=A0A9P6H8C8_9AGAM|nr:hypothetical protein BJ322DRAFT_260561 [Thelephora terrestris]
MYFAGIMDHLSDAPKMELIVWGSTMGILASSTFRVRRQLASARSKAGNIKPGSTGPCTQTTLAILGQVGGMSLPTLVYWTATACNKFHQPEWMTEYALPAPPDVFGADGVVVGRAVGLLAFLVGTTLTRSALKALGDQFHAIGIREKPRLVDSGPYAYVRHPIYTGNLIIATSFALAFWSYIPLYALPITIGGHLLKLPIEERTLTEDPVLGNEYKVYKFRVPYRIIPYIW